MTLVGFGLGHPAAQPGLGDTELLRQLSVGLSPWRASSTARRWNPGGYAAGIQTPLQATSVAQHQVSRKACSGHTPLFVTQSWIRLA